MTQMHSFARGFAALVLGAAFVLACSSFSEGDAPAAAADAGSGAETGPGPATCVSPTLVDDPTAKPDDRCGPGGAVVALSDDLDHCGACNHVCGLPGACADGMCSPTRRLESTAVVSALVVGGTVHAVDTNRRVLHAETTAKDGVPYPGTLLPAQTVVRRMETDDTWLYLSTSTGPMRFRLDGSERAQLDEVALDGLIAVGTTAYFYASDGGIEKHDKADARVLLTAPSPGTTNVVADGDEAYWAAKKGDTASLYGPFPGTDVLATASSIDALAIDAEYIYFANTKGRQLRRVSRRGGSSQAVATEPGTRVGSIALDGDYVYWTADRGSVDGWVLSRVAKCGGVPLTLLTVQPELTQLSFDASHLFVARVSPTSAELISIAK
jgi:hypothetical protein